MTRKELIDLRRLLENEKNRILRINELLEREDVIEFLKLKGIDENKLDATNEWAILREILEKFEITSTNGIYVCVGTYCTDCYISYEDTNWYTKEVDFDSKEREYRMYQDIEDGRIKKAYFEQPLYKRPVELAMHFERDNIVLNPYNTNKGSNGYYEVKEMFFTTAIKSGQAKAKKLVLSKFNRMNWVNSIECK